MTFHHKVLRDFENVGIFIYKELFNLAEDKFGHIGVMDKLRLKLSFQTAIDNRLKNEPTFYTNRNWGTKKVSMADRQQLGRVLESVIYDFKF